MLKTRRNTDKENSCTPVLFQRIETRADGGLRERQSRFERDEEGAEEEAQSGVAELPAAGSRGSQVLQYPQIGPAAPEAATAKGISGKYGCDRHRLNTLSVLYLVPPLLALSR